MIALIVVALGAVAAAVGTGVLTARGTRNPRAYFVAWTIALFGLAVGLGATTLGDVAGYSALIFRAMELGAQLIAPLSLCVALVEIAGRGLGARFAMRLVVSGIAIIAVVVLGTDPVSPDVTFGTKWPDPSVYYQLAPLAVLGFLALFTAATALGALAIAMTRSSRGQLPPSEKAVALNLAAAAFFVVLPGLAWLAHKSLGIAPPLPDKDIFAVCCLLAVVLTWYAARIAGDRDLSQARSAADSSGQADGDWDDDRVDSYRHAGTSAYEGYETGEFDEYGSGGRVGSHRRNSDEPDSEIRYPALAALAADVADLTDVHGRLSEPGSFPHTGQFDDMNRRYSEAEDYYLEQRHRLRDSDDPKAELFGQITIYTLVEGRTADFDRLTEWVVAQVRSAEPDTLVYIVHAVPTAPLQRILYEVYRDRTAHEEHLRRRYVMTYEAEQAPFVLATNVIELGLQQAKVSPLPSFSAISDILSESGIDLTGIAGSRQQPNRQPAHDSRHQYDRQPRYEARPEYEAPYQGWAEIRGEDSRY